MDELAFLVGKGLVMFFQPLEELLAEVVLLYFRFSCRKPAIRGCIGEMFVDCHLNVPGAFNNGWPEIFITGDDGDFILRTGRRIIVWRLVLKSPRRNTNAGKRIQTINPVALLRFAAAAKHAAPRKAAQRGSLEVVKTMPATSASHGRWLA